MIFRTLIIALLSVGMWATATIAEVHSGHAPISHLGVTSGGESIEKIDFCCHTQVEDVCPPSSSGNAPGLLTPKQPTPDPVSDVDMADSNLLPNRLLCEIGKTSNSDLPRSVVAVPIYLTTLRLRL